MEKGLEQLANIDTNARRDKFAAINRDGYKKPAMFELEPSYLKTAEFNKADLTPDQWRRKITELALRLGRTVKKGPEPLDNEEAIKIFEELVGSISEAEQTVMFYENDPSQPVKLDVMTDLKLDFSLIVEDVIEAIEKRGINMQQKEEEKMFRDGKFTAEDQSRVRNIFLTNKDNGQQVDIVAKRIRLSRVQSNPFEELQIMQKIQAAGLPSPKPIASLEARGNYYVLMEKVGGVNLKKILKKPELLKEVMGEENFNPDKIDEYIEKIREIMISIEASYLQEGILRKNFQRDTQDIMVDYDKDSNKWIITPIDFEPVRLLKTVD